MESNNKKGKGKLLNGKQINKKYGTMSTGKLYDFNEEKNGDMTLDDLQHELFSSLQPDDNMKLQINEKLVYAITNQQTRVVLVGIFKMGCNEWVVCKNGTLGSNAVIKNFQKHDLIKKEFIDQRQLSVDLLDSESCYKLAVRFINCIKEKRLEYLIIKCTLDITFKSNNPSFDTIIGREGKIIHYYAITVDFALTPTIILPTQKQNRYTNSNKPKKYRTKSSLNNNNNNNDLLRKSIANNNKRRQSVGNLARIKEGDRK